MKSKNKVAQQQTKKPNVSTPPANKPKKRGISSYSTAEMATHLATRGYSIQKANQKAELKPYPIQEEKGSTEGPVMSTNCEAERQSPVQSLFKSLEFSNHKLRTHVNVLENKARLLFGYDCEANDPKSEDAAHALMAFGLADNHRMVLLNRLENVTNAIAEFVG